MGPIRIKEMLPDLTLQNHEGVDVNIRELTKDAGAVFFIYPKGLLKNSL
jgi:peroxiredoxin